MQNDQIIYCADAIAYHQDEGKIVIVQRLSTVPGLALPGGKRENNESLSETISREFSEETGLIFIPRGIWCTYAESGRDPRGNYVSTVFYGTARGVPKDENGKTKVILMERDIILASLDRFVFDHGCVLSEFLYRS
jgi:ADP-ribose pyrophosphatase YjhB (NUDIX family)